MNKRGISFMAILVLALVIMYCFSVYYLYIHEKDKMPSAKIGIVQGNVVSVYQDMETRLFYIDQAAKYAAFESVFNLSENSGCDGYWFKENDCFPDKTKLEENYEKYFNENFNVYSNENYDITFDGNFIIAKAKREIKIERDNIVYSLMPNLKIDLGYDFIDFLQISQKAKDTKEKCKEDVKCWQDSGFSVVQNGKVFNIEANTKKRIGFFEQKDIIIKFKIDFSENNQLFT